MPSEAGSDLYRDLAHARALHRVITDLVAELGATLDRIGSAPESNAALSRSAAPVTNVGNEHDD
ncbi:hypothetical protein AS149_27645 [Burkholderia cenocepacia]|nr:hypothetical protein AS149_27645 [Burkholderia cenocepacia]